MNGQDVKRNPVTEPVDPIALGCCLRACMASDTEKQAFLQTFQNADNRERYHMLLRERQALLQIIHEKEEVIGQIDYMMHLLERQQNSESGKASPPGKLAREA